MGGKPDSRAEMDKFRRRLIHAVAHVLREKRPLQDLWPTMKASTFNCEQLWERMRALTLKKLSRLLPVEDRLDRLAKAARMTLTDWLMFDLVLVHEPIDLITLETKTAATPNVLGELFLLVQMFNLEGPNSTAASPAGWAAATLRYNQHNHRQCSPMLLQKRWYQLKQATREKFYAFWDVYKGKDTSLAKASNLAPSRLQCAIANKYPHIIVNEFPTWEDLMEQRMIVLPDQLAEQIRLPDLPKPRNVNDPDLILIETEVETIDLGQDSDSEEREPTPQNNENLIENCYESGINTDGPLIEITNVTGNADTDAINVQNCVTLNQVDPLNYVNIDSTITIKQENVDTEGEVPPIEEIDLIDEFEADQIDQTDINDTEIALSVEKNAICNSVQDDSVIEENKEQPKDDRSKTAVDTFYDNDLFTDQIMTDDLEFVDDGIEFVEDDEMVDSDVTQSVPAEVVMESNINDNQNSESTEEQVTSKEEPVENASEPPKFDLKLLMYPVVYTKKVDHISVLKNMDILVDETIYVKDILQEIILESTPVSDKAVNIKNEIEINCSNDKDLTYPEEIKSTDDIIMLSSINSVISETKKEVEYENQQILISSAENEALDDSPDTEMVPEEQRVKPTSRLLQKPRVREYSTVQLCKNPDFNTRLKRLSPSFCLISRNRQFLKICKPLSIDVHKDFESKLINGTLYLKSAGKTEVMSETGETTTFTSITPTAIPAQSLVDQETIDMKQLMAYSTIVTTKPINNPLMEQEIPIITRINNNNQGTNIYDNHDTEKDVIKVRQINNNLTTNDISPLNTEINDKTQPAVKKPYRPQKYVPVPWTILKNNPYETGNLTLPTLKKMLGVLGHSDDNNTTNIKSSEVKVVKPKHKYCCWYKQYKSKTKLKSRRIRPHPCGDICTCCCNVEIQGADRFDSFNDSISETQPNISHETELAVAQLQEVPGEENVQLDVTQKSAEVDNNINRQSYDECIVLSDEEKDMCVQPAKNVKSKRPRNRRAPVRTRIVPTLNNFEMTSNPSVPVPFGIVPKDNISTMSNTHSKDNISTMLNTHSLLAQNIVPAFKVYSDPKTYIQTEKPQLNTNENLEGNNIQSNTENDKYPGSLLMSITIDGKPIDVAVTRDLVSQIKNTNTLLGNMQTLTSVDKDVSVNHDSATLHEDATVINIPNETTSPSNKPQLSLLKDLSLVVTPNRQVLPILKDGCETFSENEIALVEHIVNSIQCQINTYMDMWQQDDTPNSQNIIDKSNTVISTEQPDIPEKVHLRKQNITINNDVHTDILETSINPVDIANNDNSTELLYGSTTNKISEIIIYEEDQNKSNLLTSECTDNSVNLMQHFNESGVNNIAIDLIINNDCENGQSKNLKKNELNNIIDTIDLSENVDDSRETVKGLRLKKFAALSESFGESKKSPIKKTSILSDLMEMSGISSDDVINATDQPPNPFLNVERHVIPVKDTLNNTINKIYPKILPKPYLVVSPLKPENNNQNDHNAVTVVDIDSDEDTIIVKKSSRRNVLHQLKTKGARIPQKRIPPKLKQISDTVVNACPSILKKQSRRKMKTILIYHYEQPNNNRKRLRKEKIEAKIDLVDSDAPIEEEYLVDSFDSDSDASQTNLIRKKINNKVSDRIACAQKDNYSAISDEAINNTIDAVVNGIDLDSDVSLSNLVENTYVKKPGEHIMYVKKVRDTVNTKLISDEAVPVKKVNYKIVNNKRIKPTRKNTGNNNEPSSDEEVSIQKVNYKIVNNKRVRPIRDGTVVSKSICDEVSAQEVNYKIVSDNLFKQIRDDTVVRKSICDEEISAQEVNDKIVSDNLFKQIRDDTVNNEPITDQEFSIQEVNDKLGSDKPGRGKKKLSELSDSDSSDDEPLAKKVMKKKETEQFIGNAQEEETEQFKRNAQEEINCTAVAHSNENDNENEKMFI